MLISTGVLLITLMSGVERNNEVKCVQNGFSTHTDVVANEAACDHLTPSPLSVLKWCVYTCDTGIALSVCHTLKEFCINRLLPHLTRVKPVILLVQ